MKDFHFDVGDEGYLGVDQIWPDGDAPENPTVEDVIAIVKKSGRMRDPYPDDLRVLAELLNQNADRARRRGVYGLEGKLREAAESASSWARGLELEDRS